MPHTNKNIDRQINLVLQQMKGIEDRSLSEFLALVNRLREEVILVIVQSGEIDGFSVSQIKGRLVSVLDAYQTKFRDLMTENQRSLFVKGIQVVDNAIESANLLKAVPYLSENTLDAARTYSAGLIKNLTVDGLQKITSQLDLAVLGQKPAHEVIKEIGTNLKDPSVFGTIRRRAELIFRTEVNRINQMATFERMKQIAKSIPGLKKEWVHSHVGFPRAGHLALHGMVIGAEDMFTLNGDKGTYEIFGPYDPLLPVGETINCRCKIIPVIEQLQKKKAA